MQRKPTTRKPTRRNSSKAKDQTWAVDMLFSSVNRSLDCVEAAMTEIRPLRDAVGVLATALCAMELSEAIGRGRDVIAYACSMLPAGSPLVDAVKCDIQLSACLGPDETWDQKRSEEETDRAIAFVRAAKKHAKVAL